MNEPVRVLVVEDDEDDFFLTQRALRRFTPGPIFHVESGRAAIDFLAGQGAYADRTLFPLPQVMFLDLKMDQVNGHEVLQWVRTHLPDRAPRIYVLTGSNEPRDHELVRNSGAAAGYIVKPLSAEHLAPIFAPPADAPSPAGAPAPVTPEFPAAAQTAGSRAPGCPSPAP